MHICINLKAAVLAVVILAAFAVIVWVGEKVLGPWA